MKNKKSEQNSSFRENFTLLGPSSLYLLPLPSPYLNHNITYHFSDQPTKYTLWELKIIAYISELLVS